MPEAIQTPVATTNTRYACAICKTTFTYHDTCAKHEWEDHARAKTSTHHASAWGEDFEFLRFPDEETFGVFVTAHCAVSQKWHGPGWYKRYTYRDSCRGCDMGETTGLEHIDDDVSGRWITREMQRRAEDLDIMFALTPDLPARFVIDGVTWRRRHVAIRADSITIDFATPEAATNPPEAVIEAWRVWLADR